LLEWDGEEATLRGSSGAIALTQIAHIHLPIPLSIFRIDHVHEFGLSQSKLMRVT
jgi:hypothetical protein